MGHLIMHMLDHITEGSCTSIHVVSSDYPCSMGLCTYKEHNSTGVNTKSGAHEKREQDMILRGQSVLDNDIISTVVFQDEELDRTRFPCETWASLHKKLVH